MAGKTFYLLPGVVASGASLMRSMQDGGSAPTALTSGTGWTVAKTATSTPYDLMIGGTKRAAATFGATAMPNAAPVDNTTGDSFRTPTRLLGTFGNSNWTAAFPVISVTAAASGAGRARLRVWKTASLTGNNTTFIKLSDDSTTGPHQLASQVITVDLSGTYVFSAHVKAGNHSVLSLTVEGGASFLTSVFDLSTVTVVSTNAGGGHGESVTSAAIANLGGGIFRVSLVGSLASASSVANMLLEIGIDSGNYAGASAWNIYATGAQIEAGSTLSAYQQTHGAAGTVNLLAYSEALADPTVWSLSGLSSAVLDGTTDPFAYPVTELTVATQTGTAISGLTTGAEQVSTVTWTPGTTFTLSNEFLFFQAAWEITGASGNSSADVLLRRNSTAVVTTPDFPITFSKPLSVRQAVKRASVY